MKKRFLVYLSLYLFSQMVLADGEWPPPPQEYLNALKDMVHSILAAPFSAIGLTTAMGPSEFNSVVKFSDVDFVDITLSETSLRSLELDLDAKKPIQVNRSALTNIANGTVETQKVDSTNAYEIVLPFLNPRNFQVFGGHVTIPGRLLMRYNNGEVHELTADQLSPRLFKILDRLIRWTVFEELYHALEQKLTSESNQYYNNNVNNWLKSIDVPVHAYERNPKMKEWMSRNGVTGGPAVFDIISRHMSMGDHYYLRILELTVFLAGLQHFPGWFEDQDFRTFIVNNHPDARAHNSPLLEAVEHFVTTSEASRDCDNFLKNKE